MTKKVKRIKSFSVLLAVWVRQRSGVQQKKCDRGICSRLVRVIDEHDGCKSRPVVRNVVIIKYTSL